MSASPYHRIARAPIERRGPGPARAAVYTGRVKSRVVVALVALAAVLLPGRMVPAEDPVAALSLIRPKPVKDAPDFQVRTPDDRQIRLADLRGKVVFLNFWATWCEPCREEMPSMERLHRAYKDRGLAVVAISLDSQGASVVNPFVKKLGLSFPVGLDPKMAVRETYGVWAVPSTFIIDRKGKRVLFANGSREWDGTAAHALIESLLK
jgi:cytochrome c biogenesis protein CcmG, thiol:disulfide interchange protein DsbE